MGYELCESEDKHLIDGVQLVLTLLLETAGMIEIGNNARDFPIPKGLPRL